MGPGRPGGHCTPRHLHLLRHSRLYLPMCPHSSPLGPRLSSPPAPTPPAITTTTTIFNFAAAPILLHDDTVEYMYYKVLRGFPPSLSAPDYIPFLHLTLTPFLSAATPLLDSTLHMLTAILQGACAEWDHVGGGKGASFSSSCQSPPPAIYYSSPTPAGGRDLRSCRNEGCVSWSCLL